MAINFRASSAKKARANGKSGWSLSLIGRKKGPEQQRKAKSFNGKPLESGKKDEENHSPLNHTPCCSCCKTCDVHQLKLTKVKLLISFAKVDYSPESHGIINTFFGIPSAFLEFEPQPSSGSDL